MGDQALLKLMAPKKRVRFLPLIMFPEGLLNGIIMTGMMVFHPDWIRTFDARHYIDEQ